MGQLIKLQDYVSRYEQDIFVYPSRYVRLKKQQWEKLRHLWESGYFDRPVEEANPIDFYEEEKDSFLQKLKSLFKKGEEEEKGLEIEQVDEDALSFSYLHGKKIHTIDELKREFLEQIFSFQMKWASTTLTEQSTVDFKYYYDEHLKYFLQRFPDTYLFMYKPVFLIKKAPVEVETILITPTEICCITFLEQGEGDVFVGSKEHFWVVKSVNEEEKKILNPLLSLNRTEKIAQKILEIDGIDLEIHKVVLCRNGYIDFPYAPYDTTFISKRNYDDWFQKMRRNRSPLKHVQLKAAQGLLQFSQTTSRKRYEWDIDVEMNEE